MKDKTISILSILNHELISLGSTIHLTSLDATYKNRYCQFYLLDQVDFWENGIFLQGNIRIENLKELAQLIYYWCEKRLPAIEIEKRVPSFRATEALKLLQSDVAGYLAIRWEELIKTNEEFTPLIQLLKEHPITNQLMPYSQLFDIGLSQYIGQWNGKFINDLPRVRAMSDGRFKVMTTAQASMNEMDMTDENPETYIGVGDAKQAIKIIIDQLPAAIGQAKFMSVEEWDKYNSLYDRTR